MDYKFFKILIIINFIFIILSFIVTSIFFKYYIEDGIWYNNLSNKLISTEVLDIDPQKSILSENTIFLNNYSISCEDNTCINNDTQQSNTYDFSSSISIFPLSEDEFLLSDKDAFYIISTNDLSVVSRFSKDYEINNTFIMDGQLKIITENKYLITFDDTYTVTSVNTLNITSDIKDVFTLDNQKIAVISKNFHDDQITLSIFDSNGELQNELNILHEGSSLTSNFKAIKVNNNEIVIFYISYEHNLVGFKYYNYHQLYQLIINTETGITTTNQVMQIGYSEESFYLDFGSSIDVLVDYDQNYIVSYSISNYIYNLIYHNSSEKEALILIKVSEDGKSLGTQVFYSEENSKKYSLYKYLNMNDNQINIGGFRYDEFYQIPILENNWHNNFIQIDSQMFYIYLCLSGILILSIGAFIALCIIYYFVMKDIGKIVNIHKDLLFILFVFYVFSLLLSKYVYGMNYFYMISLFIVVSGYLYYHKIKITNGLFYLMDGLFVLSIFILFINKNDWIKTVSQSLPLTFLLINSVIFYLITIKLIDNQNTCSQTLLE